MCALRLRTDGTRSAIAILALISGLSSCRAAALAYGDTPASARANAEGVTTALEQRFTHVVRVPKFQNARMRIARYVFSPSRIVDDSSLWTSVRSENGRSVRDLEIFGSFANGQYTFVPRAVRLPIMRLGESRHFTGVRQLDGDGRWQWVTSVEQVMGPMPPARATDIMRALFVSAEQSSATVRADYRSAFPRSTQAFGRMFTIDSLNTSTQGDGSTLVSLHILTSDDRLYTGSPALGKFIRRYIASTRFHVRLSDKTGSDWFDANQDHSRLILRFRTHNGELQPLLGAARPMPDTLAIRMDGDAKLSMFTVGIQKLVGEFVHVSTTTERGWSMRFTTEPSWKLPFMAEQLLRSSLRQPFTGEGTQFRIGFARNGAQPTTLQRSVVLSVQESAIMRFLGNLGFTAMSDYAGAVEEEENRFLAQGFAALRADIAGLTAGR